MEPERISLPNAARKLGLRPWTLRRQVRDGKVPFRIEVVNLAKDDTHDLMEDLVAVLTSFSARLYGQRRGRKKTEAAIKAIQETAP